MAYIVRSFTPCFTLWFDVGIYVVCETPPTTYTQLTYTPSAGYN